jgi:putative transposase
MAGALELAHAVGTARACRALGVPRASLYRQRRSPGRVPAPRPRPARALTPPERQTVLDLLHNERFVDQAPTEVYATLLDEGTYHCSPRTMYRLLAEAQEVRERRNQLRQVAPKPELLATGPNQVWSWDITKLLGPVKWTYFSLYVILDIFSRYVVGWMVAHQESATLAERLIDATCKKQAISPGQLLIHADRGPSMTSKPVALLLADLGVTRTHSRPHVSNDNPYSEAQFKTLKYRPEFPDRFGFIEEARGFCQRFFAWYNTEHHHSGIGLLTPVVVHYGGSDQVLAQRQHVLAAAYAAHPERFVRQPPTPPALPPAVWINRPQPVHPAPEGGTGGHPDMASSPIAAPGGAEALTFRDDWAPSPFFTPTHPLQVVRGRSATASHGHETSTQDAGAEQPVTPAPPSTKALQ